MVLCCGLALRGLERRGHPARGACILAVVDVVEAMISHRPEREALPLEGALAELADGAGSRYHTAAREAAIRLFRQQGFALPAGASRPPGVS
jgi:HD-GYP domain-containing protein (c-di-GMP phosphodiesterase class II)